MKASRLAICNVFVTGKRSGGSLLQDTIFHSVIGSKTESRAQLASVEADTA
jgi:hypothetical protein